MRKWDWPTGVAATLLAVALTLAAVPFTQSSSSAQQSISEKLAVVEARVNDLSRADLPQRVTRIETETQQASALLKAILGWLGAMSAASPFAYTGLRKHITRTVTETVPTRKQH